MFGMGMGTGMGIGTATMVVRFWSCAGRGLGKEEGVAD